MKNDPTRLRLRDELRQLRRGNGNLSADRIAVSEELVNVIGMGSAEQAYATFIDMLKRYAIEPEGDIRAYLETCGVGLDGDTLNERLDAYAAVHFVDPRTALRRSDRGADKLATIFRDEILFNRPWGNIVLYQFGDLVNVSIALHIDPHAEYKPPVVWINDAELEGLAFEFKDTGAPTGYRRALEHIDGHELRRDKQWLFKIDVNWRMPVWPQWVLGAQLADNRLVVKLQTQRNFMTEATISWGGAVEATMPAVGESFRSFTTNGGGDQ
ncbi:hypothetical protein [Cryobacterium lyxosi]|uniref:Uncharacterized protein n=1 Tax=Cryobacterium lyxosi TaxID=1259228 RepID=A0A4R8ZIX5_9MICO|nr:hypothetical protein [Cryobacterium lyxosi]TFD27346.1 hypothetical protein E3T27_06210 [Cryobacterium lyxosi]